LGQIESRKIFKGQVRNDLAPVENVIVFLMQIQKWAIVNEYGFFTVLQRNDTLVFQV
jgi:hypothetical protein